MSNCAMNFAPPGEFGRVARHPVVEARTDRYQAIAVVDRVIGERRTVHAEHAHRQGIGGVDRADSHQRRHHRDPQLPAEFAQGGCSAGVYHTAAGVDHRPLGGAESREEIRTGGLRQFAGAQAGHALPVAGHR